MEIQIKKGLDSLQTETVLRLLSQTVWACSRRKEAIIESWKHSVCYGAYTADGRQIGFARVITDYATQYYICDVVVDVDFRHRGVGTSLLKTITTGALRFPKRFNLFYDKKRNTGGSHE